jgi:hypothetical protein
LSFIGEYEESSLGISRLFRRVLLFFYRLVDVLDARGQ